MSSSIRDMNKEIITKEDWYEDIMGQFKEVEKFVSNMGWLTFGRDYLLCGEKCFSLQNIIVSLELTAGSIASCVENAVFADAAILLRKYRDDLFFYLYISLYNRQQKQGMPSAEKMARNISKWLNNGLKNFDFKKDVLKTIEEDATFNELFQEYDINGSLRHIGRQLNDFVHANKYNCYNRNINAYSTDELKIHAEDVVSNMLYLTVCFVVLLILVSPLSVMASDYIDALDCNMVPPENSEYWVAPFVEKFLSKNAKLIDDNCYGYLKNHTTMQL